MKYQDGNEIRAWDEILLDGGMIGVVLCCFDSSEYTPDIDYDNWIDLFKTGAYGRFGSNRFNLLF